MRKVNVHEAKTHLSKLLEAAHAGEEIVIAKDGEPYARLVPLEKGAPRRLGILKGKGKVDARFFEPLPEEELEAWSK